MKFSAKRNNRLGAIRIYRRVAPGIYGIKKQKPVDIAVHRFLAFGELLKGYNIYCINFQTRTTDEREVICLLLYYT